ncbi:MAG: glycine zipper domain-containing protein [Candidatus Omnitrophota bacterium]
MKKIFLIMLVSVSLIGCTGTQKGATIGGIAGAALGGIIGYQSGHGVEGALIGGGVGAAGGALTGDAMEEKK